MTALWVAAQTASAASTPQLRVEWMERAAPLAALDPHRETRVAFGLELSAARLAVGDARGAFAALAEVEVEGDPSVAPAALGERWLTIGEAALGRGDLALAAQSLGNASRACDGAQAHACVGRAEEGLGAEALRRGAIAEARSHLLRAALAHQSAGDGAAAVRCLGAAAEHSLALERFEAAEEDFAQALQSAGDLSGPQIGALHAGRAYALLRLGRPEEASASARFALLSREPRDLARAHLVLGTVALERGQGETALSELTLALQAGDVGLSAELGWRVIVAAGLAGAWDVVLSRAQTALATAPAPERRGVLDAISAAHLATQTPGDARAWHLALLSEARAAEDGAAEIVALLGVGLAHLGEDHAVEAGAVLEQALDLADGRGADADKGAALVALARVSAAQGRPPEAQALARRALALLSSPEARWRRRAAEAFVADLEALAEPTPSGAVN